MLPITEYKGTFSFVSSRLYNNIKSVLPHYNEKDPETWPYIALATIEKHCPYRGYPDLPTGVAYERSVLERYEEMYSAEERRQGASLNGSFHERYPFNYDEHDVLKDQVDITSSEYGGYIEDEPDVAVDEPDVVADEPDIRREAARLRGKLFDKNSQLMSSQQNLKEYEAAESWRRNAVSNAEYELGKQRQRADAAERECMLQKTSNIQLVERIKNLEAYCTQLEENITVMDGGRGRKQIQVIDVDSDEDLMEGLGYSEMRSSSLG
ncbi:uncharacterized protein SETTUDRAFT_134070 [Exserohilum turcica Et28A]|uniref:Uncharacterized protein n=1 Tax=Exserohilum turcicum (strain 28A) TaxID=671987 RepID=R0KWD8_EXST2|nr:uncharacterized protein SETTUDRAFT_134070 [Exserohilum turcica Et28A]EOA92042.1 hypothetical protein SETTUDRAFT_134070 [Exserohilum turcica Et28A]